MERNLAQGQEQNYESRTSLHINRNGVRRESERDRACERGRQ